MRPSEDLRQAANRVLEINKDRHGLEADKKEHRRRTIFFSIAVLFCASSSMAAKQAIDSILVVFATKVF
jgi:hypothetical protein